MYILSELLTCTRCRLLQSVLQQYQHSAVRLCSGVACNHYDVLGIHRNASKEEIREAFVKLSKELHPDRNPDDPDTHHKFVRLNEAYTTLSKPKSRGDYDLQFHMHQHQRAAQAASSYSYGGSYRPGTGFSPGSDSDERVFWDETIFHMRNKNKDKTDIKDDEYYGVKGVRKLSDATIVIACLVFVGVGAILQFGVIAKTSKSNIKMMNEKDIKAGKAHRTAVETARLHGNKTQIELMKKKMMAMNPLEGDPSGR